MVLSFINTSFKPTIKFLYFLRSCEYYGGKHFFNKFLYLIFKVLKYKQGLKCSFTIPEESVMLACNYPTMVQYW